VWRAYQIYTRAAGIDKVGKIVRENLNRLLASAIARREVMAANEHGVSDLTLRVVRLPDSPVVIVRTLGDRKFDEIPPSEVAEVMRQVEKKVGHNRECLYRAVLAQYGLKRMTRHVTQELDRIRRDFLSKSDR
jgi:hypothetical protein